MKENVLDCGFVELIDSMPAASNAERYSEEWGPGDQRIADAARVLDPDDRGGVRDVALDQKLLRRMWGNPAKNQHRHTSPFEKVRFEFSVKAPLFVARQWMRHRTGSFNEKSARYSEMTHEFYYPALDRMATQSQTNKQGSADGLDAKEAQKARSLMIDSCTLSFDFYTHLLALGLTRELARCVLPVNLYTQFWWTVDLHNLLHFLELRVHADAQFEIRVYAQAIQKQIKTVAPFVVFMMECPA